MVTKKIEKCYLKVAHHNAFLLESFHMDLIKECRFLYRERRMVGGKPEDVVTEVAEIIVYQSAGLGEVQVYTLVDSCADERTVYLSILMESDIDESVKNIVRVLADKLAFDTRSQELPPKHVGLRTFSSYLSEWYKVPQNRFL